MVQSTLYNSGIAYKKLSTDNFSFRSLDNFIRRQEVFECWRKISGEYKLKSVRYTEDWDIDELRSLAERISDGLKQGCIAYGAFAENDPIAFAYLENTLFGTEKQYLNLAEFYVSLPYRRKGIGKQLFSLICREAKKMGAAKLYVSAHSAKESIAAYKKYGCVPATEINRALADKEPYDLQLEYSLNLRIYEVKNKRSFMPLLLLGDEQERMIEKYLDRCTVYVVDDNGIKGEIAVTVTDNNVAEIKNLAVLPSFQKTGYGRKLVEFVCEKYKRDCSVLRVGTGDSPLTIPFYEKCGFVRSHTVKNFFLDNYDHPIIEDGKQLVDMIYLEKKLSCD